MSIIVVSVGTSLLTNNIDHLNCAKEVMKAFEKNQIPVGEIKIEMNSSNLEVKPEIDGLWDFTQDFMKTYFEEDEIKKNIARRGKGEDLLPAEISSLYLYYYDRDGKLRKEFGNRLTRDSDSEFAEKDQVVLLATDTADAVYCARLLKEMINQVSLFNTKCRVDEVKVIENLDVFDPSKWAPGGPGGDSGLDNLYTCFHNLSEGPDPGVDKVLIRTGGYKELSANLLMLAIEKGFQSYYLFERSYEFIFVKRMGAWPSSYREIATSMQRRA